MNKNNELILKLAASFTLADHLGDVADDIDYLLKQIGFESSWGSQEELASILAEMGVTTLYGTTLSD